MGVHNVSLWSEQFQRRERTHAITTPYMQHKAFSQFLENIVLSVN